MLSVLVEGTLLAAPVRRTSARGSAFVTAQLRVHTDDGESCLCSVIAFQPQAAEALAALGAGATVAVTGPGAISRWQKDGEPRVGLRVTATRVMAVQEAVMRRRAASAELELRSGLPAPAAPLGLSHPAGRQAARTPLGRLEDWDNDEPV